LALFFTELFFADLTAEPFLTLLGVVGAMVAVVLCCCG
jgi:hypothetical protein